MNPPNSSRSPWFAIAIVAGLVVLYLVVAGHVVRRALPNADEGFYAAVAREVMRGRVPYRDFAYTQTPVLPYLQGAAMSVVGFGVREQRWLNAVCGLATLLLALRLWRRHGLDWLHCAALAIVWSLCVSLAYYTIIGKTYAWAQLWLVIAGLALCLRDRPWTSLIVLSVAGVLAVGCRLTTAPAVVVLWFGLVVMQRTRSSFSSPMLVAVPLLAACAILGPFVVADPRNAYYWTVQYHLLSALPAQRAGIFWLSVRLAPVIALLAVAGAFVALRHRREPGAWMMFAGVTGWLVAVIGPGVYADYAIPCFALVLTGAGCLFAQVRLSDARFARGLPYLLAALAVGGLFLPAEEYFLDGYLDSVDRTAKYVRERSQPDDQVLTPMPEIPVSAGRNVVPGLELGKFGLTADMDDAAAQRRHVLTLGQLTEAFEKRSAAIVVLSQLRNGNFLWSVPTLARFNPRTRTELFTKLAQGYDCTYADDFFLVFERKGPPRKSYPVDPAAL